MTDIKALLKEAQPAERSVPVCLRLDLVRQHEAAERELEEAQRKPRTLAGTAGADVAGRIREIEAQMRGATVEWRLRAMGRLFERLIDAHPPRKLDDGSAHSDDMRLGANAETFPPALIKASTISPALDDEDWLTLFGNPDDDASAGVLTLRQRQVLFNACWELNAEDVDVPFSLAASMTTRTSSPE